MKDIFSAILLGTISVPIVVIDIREKRIPDVLSIGGVAGCCILSLLFGEDLLPVLVAAGVGFGIFFGIRVLTGGKLGLGDVKYSALISAALGVKGWFVSMFFSSLISLAAVVIMLTIIHIDKDSKIPFAPILASGAYCGIVISLTVPDFFFMLTGAIFV